MLSKFIIFIFNFLILALITFYFYNIGRVLAKKATLKKTNISVNIIIGLGFFISAINFIYFIGLRDFKVILLLVFIHILIFFFLFLKKKKIFILDSKLFFIFITFILVSLSSYDHKFLNFDDFYGYSNLYMNIINNNYNFSPELQIRGHVLSFGYSFIQSIFIFLNDISRIHFFDQTFGTLLILIYFYENFYLSSTNKNKSDFFFYFFFIIISTISISETSQPKIIIYAITLIILSELKKFSDDSQNICTLVCLLFVGWNLKYLYIISYIYIAFFIFLLIKILRNKIKLKENLKNIIYLLFFFLIPDFINKFDIFGTISPIIFKSKYDITENFFLKEVEFVRDFDMKTYFIFWSLVFLKKHFLVISALFFILFFRKQKFYFNVILFLSYCTSVIIISFLWFPDQFNPKRYLWPLESALIVFFVLQIIHDKFLTNFKEKYKYLFKFSFALGCIYLALLTPKPWNFYELFKNKFQNIYNVFSSSDSLNKNFFFKNKIPNQNIIKEYQREFYLCFNTLDKDKDILSILNYPFLINEKKLRQLEINTGFLFTKHPYPIFQSFHEKNKFLKKNYEGIIIEKNLIYNNSILDEDLSEFNYRLNKEKINLTGFYPNYTKYDMLNLITWLDFVSFLQKLKFLSKVNCETNNFISFKF